MLLSLISLSVLGLAAAAGNHSPALVNTCLVTSDVPRLVEFYQAVLQIRPEASGTDYAEFPTGVGVLAIYSAAAEEKYIPGSAEPGSNRSAILEFKVDDMDTQYARLKKLVKSGSSLPRTSLGALALSTFAIPMATLSISGRRFRPGSALAPIRN